MWENRWKNTGIDPKGIFVWNMYFLHFLGGIISFNCFLGWLERDRNILKHLDTLYVLNFVSFFLRILIEPILDPCGLSRPWSCPRRCRFQKPHFSVKTVVAEKSKNPAHVSLARAHFLVKFVWHKEDLFKTFNVMISSPKWSTWTYHALVANRKAATAWIWGPWPVAMHRTLISRLFCAHKIHKNDSRICDELFQPKAAQILEISFFIFLKPPTEQWCTNRPRNNRHTYWGSGQEEIRAPFLLLLSILSTIQKIYMEGSWVWSVYKTEWKWYSGSLTHTAPI